MAIISTTIRDKKKKVVLDLIQDNEPLSQYDLWKLCIENNILQSYSYLRQIIDILEAEQKVMATMKMNERGKTVKILKIAQNNMRGIKNG